MPETAMLATRRLALAAMLIAALAACRDEVAAPPSTAEVAPAPDVAAVATPAAPSGPALGAFGVDTTGMDTTVKPGDDFNGYANGNWIRNTPIPSDRSRYSMFTLLTEKALERTRAIVEEAAAKDAAAGDERKVGDFYVAFMDEAGIETKGLASLKPALDEIAAIADRTRLAILLGGSLRADVDLLNSTDYYTDRLFGLWVSQHLDRPTEVAPYLVQGGLGLPDRDFYLEGGRYDAIRTQYTAYVAKLLGLAGLADPDAKAARIVALETAIARVHATQLETNDVKRGANYWKREEFATRAPGLDWNAFFEAAGLAAQPELIVWQPGAVTGIAKLVGAEPLATWQDYLAFHALDRAAPFLPKAFVDARFAFRDSVLEGTPQQQERWKRALNFLNESLGEAVGKLYVARHFTPQTKARADAMVANVIAAFDGRIDKLEWMTPATKARAKAKLARLEVGMGYPDAWRDHGALEVARDDALGNIGRAELFEYRRNLAKLGKPVDRGEWYLLPQEVNALNVPLENRLIFPAAILEAPFFDGAADDAVNYGAIGGVIGHEITHSFDSSGALFDETGRLSNWWTPEDLTRFEAAGAALAAQYDGYKAFPDLSLNGKLTLSENIADVAGLATAHDAYLLSQQGQSPVVLDGFTPDQRFFLGWAQQWRSLYREPALRNAIVTNVHAPGEYRAATVRNIDAWYEAFGVANGSARYLAPDARVKVW